MPPVPTPPPPHRITPSTVAIAVAVVAIFRPLLHASAVAHVCSSSTTTTTLCSSVSLPSYPFSQVPGCGHPAFQIRCSPPHWIITINQISFAVKEHKPNSTSLTIYPVTNYMRSDRSFCSATTLLPNRSIDLSGSPFRFPHSLCSRFSVIRPCPRSNAPNCSVCNWECELVNSPVRLLQGCETNRRQDSEQGCKEDVLDYLETFLKYGFPVEWSEDRDTYFSSCRACQARNGVCGFNSSDPKMQFLCFHSQSHQQSHMQPPPNRKPTSNLIVLLCALFILSGLLLVIAVATLIWRCRAIKASSNEEGEEEEDPTIMFLHRHRSANPLPPVFTFEELESSTNRFDPRRKIGDGGFGCVYLGQLYDGRVVAVKRLHSRPQNASNKSFCNEILILSSIDHPNLVKLHGYCSDPRGLLLVYDYVPNGTLADHLHGSQTRKGSLTWQVRVEIALQTALAIEYLHFSVVPPIVHRDITSSNIFVDKDLRIKLGDFGLSRLLIFGTESSSGPGSSGSGSGSDCIWTGPQGTPGYLDPDYHRSFRLTEKSDVYSFGVVMFELISGMKAVDVRREKREVGLADLVVSKIQLGSLHQVVDPSLMVVGGEGGGCSGAIGTVDAMAELAFRCVAADKDDRPDAKEVVAELKRIRSRARGCPMTSNSSDACNNI